MIRYQLLRSKYINIIRNSSNISNIQIRFYNFYMPFFEESDWISVLRGARNGIYYGGKVRAIHSLVMMLLFKSFSPSELKNIIKLSWEHAKNLGLFVFSYKAMCIALTKLWGDRPMNSFISGFIFGGLIFGRKTPVNVQIVLYLLSRVIIASVTLLYKTYFNSRWRQIQKPPERKYGHLVLAAVVWGLVMFLFEVDKSTLQPSLTSSMQYLYVQSNKPLKDWRDLVPFYIPKF